MYPDRELNRLAAHKAALRQRIARRRAQCTAAAARVAQPFAWLDRLRAFWRRLPVFAQLAAGPLGAVVQRAAFPRRKFLGSLLRWGPLVLGGIRGLGAAVKSRAASAATPPPGRRARPHKL